MKDYLLDTNMISAMLKQNEAVWQKVEEVDFTQDKIFGSEAIWVTVPSGLAVLGHHPDGLTTQEFKAAL